MTRIHAMRHQKQSLRAIARVLNDEKIPTKPGQVTDANGVVTSKGWQANTVRMAQAQRLAEVKPV